MKLKLHHLHHQPTFTTLIDTHSATALRLAQRLLGDADAAADAFQDALLRAYRAWSTCKGHNQRAWLLRIVTNSCYDYLARQKRRPATSLDAFLETQGESEAKIMQPDLPTPDQGLCQKETLETILHAIEQLSDAQRHILHRVDVEGYAYAEVAAELRVPMGTIKSHLFRARAQVRDQLVDAGLVPGRVVS